MIKSLVLGGMISLCVLNRRFSTFPFQGIDKKSRPPTLSHGSIFGVASIKGTAAEKWCLFRFFSFLVGDAVPEGNAAYDVYLRLRSVVDIVCSPQLTVETVPFLQAQIADFYESFCELFPDVSCIPKMHYLVHYPRLILMYGPLSRLSSMRFEAKHQYFKSLVRKTRSFTNVCRSLSLRHQMNQMFRLAHTDELKTTVSKQSSFSSLPELLQQRLEELGLQGCDLSTVQSVTIMGRTFRVRCVLPAKVCDDELPDFALATMIVLCQRRFFIHASLHRTVSFDEHFHAYVIRCTESDTLIEDSQHYKQFHALLHLYRVNGKAYVNVRYEMIT